MTPSQNLEIAKNPHITLEKLSRNPQKPLKNSKNNSK
jgi:hypothetical protein